MATIKSYTDIEQSKKLTEILSIESADMFWKYNSNIHTYDDIPKILVVNNWDDDYNKNIPCWSLTALLRVLTENKICHYDDRYYCQYMSEGDEFPIYSTAEYDNPVDACVEMIKKLHELNLL